MNIKLFFNKLLRSGGVVFDLFKWTIFIAIVLSLIFTFWLSLFIVDGTSMDPTLKNGSWVLLNRSVYNAKNPTRGDIVVTKYPGDPNNKKYVKRVVGLPGEKVSVKEGLVYIDDAELTENYLPFDIETYPDGEWTLSNDEFFLMGDNRPNSNDSRYFGPVERRFLVGRAVAVILPRFSDLSNK